MASMGLALVDMEALSTREQNLDMDEALVEDSNNLAAINAFDYLAFAVVTSAAIVDF